MSDTKRRSYSVHDVYGVSNNVTRHVRTVRRVRGNNSRRDNELFAKNDMRETMKRLEDKIPGITAECRSITREARTDGTKLRYKYYKKQGRFLKIRG